MGKLAQEITNSEFKLIPMGSLEQFGEQIKQQRAENPAGEKEIFSRWQGAQYMHGQFKTHHQSLDNLRYDGLKWIGAKKFIEAIVK